MQLSHIRAQFCAIDSVWRLALSSYLRQQLVVLRVDNLKAVVEHFINNINFVLLQGSP